MGSGVAMESKMSKSDPDAALTMLTTLCKLALLTVRKHRPGKKKGLSKAQSTALGEQLWAMVAAIPLEPDAPMAVSVSL